MNNEGGQRRTDYSRPKPKGVTRFLVRFPIFLYRIHLGWIFWHRCLLLTHVGRKTGKIRRNVVEVFWYDKNRRESFVASAWGNKSDWYLNIKKNNPISVLTGGERYVPSFRTLSIDEAQSVLKSFSTKHKRESNFFLNSFFPSERNQMAFEDLSKILPIVAFRPKEIT